MGTKTTYLRKVAMWVRGPRVAQRVSRGGKSLGGAGGRGEGWRGMGTKTTYPRKVAIWVGGPGVAQGVPRGSKSRGGARGESP